MSQTTANTHIANNVTDLVGNTPLLRLNKVTAGVNAEVLIKLESFNPASSVKARELAEENPNYLLLQQFNNPANPAAHRATTAEEIWRDTGGNIDILISGVGTGGTITGVAEILKSYNPKLKAIAIEPSSGERYLSTWLFDKLDEK